MSSKLRIRTTEQDSQSLTRKIPTKTSNIGRLIGIDGLKAIAIIGVTLFHMFPQDVQGGYLGVSLFLLLTGYLLAYTSERDWTKKKYSTIRYFIKRFKRIYPSLIAVILITIGIYHFLLPDSLGGIRQEIASILLGYNNWWQINQNADYFTRLTNTSPFTHLWFMGIELQYFIIWPILFLLYRLFYTRIGYKFALSFIAILAIASAFLMPYMYVPEQDVTRLYYGTDTRVYALLFGAFLGLIRANHQTTTSSSFIKRFIASLFFAILTIGIIIGYILLDGQNPIVYQGGMLLATVGFCIMVVLTDNNSLPIGKVLDNPIMRWLGQHCYSIFLWQYPVLFLFQKSKWQDAIANPYLYNGLIILIILLLTLWTDTLIGYLNKIGSFQNFLTTIKKPMFMVIAIISCIFMGLGLFGTFTAAEHKVNDLEELQKRLAANAALIQQENERIQQKQAHTKQVVQESLNGVACIGDSVMLGSADSLRKALPDAYIDAKVSRYVGDGLPIAKQMDASGHLGKVVLIGLGTNGPISGSRYEKGTTDLVKYLGNDREIFWINVYCPDCKWQNTNNEYLAKLAKEHPNITIIDWYGLISKHKEWLTGDGVHPNLQGIKEYVKLVHETMEKRLSEKENSK